MTPGTSERGTPGPREKGERTLIVVFGRRRGRARMRVDEWRGFTFRRLLVMWGRTDFAARLGALLNGFGGSRGDPEDRT